MVYAIFLGVTIKVDVRAKYSGFLEPCILRAICLQSAMISFVSLQLVTKRVLIDNPL